jgi:hypothetical protein
VRKYPGSTTRTRIPSGPTSAASAIAGEPPERGDVYHRASASGPHHRQRRPDQPQWAKQVEIDQPCCLCRAGLLHRAQQASPGVVHDGIEPAEAFDREAHGFLWLALRGHIQLYEFSR